MTEIPNRDVRCDPFANDPGKELPRSIGRVSGKARAAAKDAPSQQLSAVAITPDGKRALVVKAPANKVALLDIDGTTGERR